ncbi:hypothetical protein SDC9_143118 [bioreactor metagenome]|uniref:Uncharacterized protein n=1 Tax=bioreactor metagenome TaxID=1076179 RepID=A0A645E5X4_9ZZZZ
MGVAFQRVLQRELDDPLIGVEVGVSECQIDEVVAGGQGRSCGHCGRFKIPVAFRDVFVFHFS